MIKTRQIPFSSIELNKIFKYENGYLFWRSADNSKNATKPLSEVILESNYRLAGYVDKINKYHIIKLKKYKYRSHRIIYKIFNPNMNENLEVDHINGDTLDNRIENLRLVNRSTNCRNMKKNKRNNSGCVGVKKIEVKTKKKHYVIYEVRISKTLIGRFPSFEEAVEVRKKAEIEYGYHENHGSR